MGGTQGWVEYSALGLVKLGNTVTVISENAPHDRKSKLLEQGIDVHAFDSPPDLLVYKRIIVEAGAEVIHLNVWERFSELIQLRAICNVPLALSYHSVPKINWKQWIVRIVKPSKRQWSMYDWFTLTEARRYIDAHIGCCEASAEGIRKKLWPFMQDKVFSLPNAIPMPEPISYDIILGPPRFLQVGALNERKNPFLTLKAFEKVQELLPDSTLSFVGSGPLYNDLQNYILEKSFKNVALVGEVADPSTFYMENNILILPSRCEGLPYTLIEGAGHGMPIIASNVDGIPEICINDHNGIVLSDISVKVLQEAMIKLGVNSDLRLNMSKNSRELVREKFDIKVFVNMLENIYDLTKSQNK